MYNLEHEFLNISYLHPAKITRSKILYKLREYAEKYAVGDLLDVGCGMKPYETVFQPFIKTYTGIDYPVSMEANYGAATKADYYEDCCNTSFGNESYDTILCTQVLEHIANPLELLTEVNRLLRVDGCAIFTIPFVWEIHTEPYDYFRFTKFGIEKLLGSSNFQIISIENCEGPLATIGQLKIISIYNRRIDNFFLKIIIKLINKIRIPIINFMCLAFDKFYDSQDNKLCLNYVVVARKVAV